MQERGSPAISQQILIQPMCDHYMPGTPSLKAYAKGFYFDDWINVWAWDFYGCCDAPHGTKEQPNTHAAVLRATLDELKGKRLLMHLIQVLPLRQLFHPAFPSAFACPRL